MTMSKGGVVRVVSLTRKIPALTVNGRYQVFVRNGVEFIQDWHNGYFPVKESQSSGVVLERIHD